MKLYLKQKVFSWRDRFSVRDESGSDRYTAKGEIFTLGKKLYVYNSNGSEAAFIRQKLLSWLPRYYIEIDGRVVCEVAKKFTFFKPSYHIEGLSWHLQGDFWEHEYSLYGNRQQIMRLSKKWFSWGDSYELDIADPQSELLCLCIALAVDCDLAEQRASSSSIR